MGNPWQWLRRVQPEIGGKLCQFRQAERTPGIG